MDVFLSYRRSDAASATGRLADRLHAALGPDRVFRDLDAIAPGADFEVALQRAIGGAAVLLAVVGPRWLTSTEAGKRRLDNPQDMVRREIEAAFAAGVAVVPVLVEGARMPTAAELPTALAPFARCQAVELDDARWDDDCARLFRLLHREGIGPAPGAPAPPSSHARLPLEALELLAHPRRVITAIACRGGRDALARAGLLLLVSLAAGHLLLASVVYDDNLVGAVFSGTLLGLLVSTLLVSCMVLGWRAAGARAGWQIAVAASACVVAGGWIYLAVGLWITVFGVSLADPGFFDHLRATIRGGGNPFVLMESARPSLLGAMVFATVAFAAGLAWLVAAWNAMRLALLRPRWAALAAAVIVVALLWTLIATARWFTQS